MAAEQLSMELGEGRGSGEAGERRGVHSLRRLCSWQRGRPRRACSVGERSGTWWRGMWRLCDGGKGNCKRVAIAGGEIETERLMEVWGACVRKIVEKGWQALVGAAQRVQKAQQQPIRRAARILLSQMLPERLHPATSKTGVQQLQGQQIPLANMC